MRWTSYFLNTLREVPADADVISQKLMMRAGMIRKVAAGIYTYLPLGLRSIKKLENIVREEMNRAGAVELLMPAIQPAELWMESGRWQKYGKELLRIKDRHDRDFVFGPTHEEVITDTVRDAVNSYRQLPVNLYQIQTKFRDEVRPRFGLMRGREFIMKDAYSFHTTRESLDETYEAMRDAYSRIFHRCALDHVPVEADTGNIGGSASHEFMVLAQSGEDAVVSCPNCRYGANIEKATSKFFDDEPEPAPMIEEMAPIHTPGTQSIDDVGKFLGKPTSQLVKTLVFDTDLGPVMVLVRGDREGNEIKIKNSPRRDVHGDAPRHALRGGDRRTGRLLRTGRHEVRARARRRLAEGPRELDRRRQQARHAHRRRERRPRFSRAGVGRLHDRLRGRSLPALLDARWRSIAASRSATSSSSARSTPTRCTARSSTRRASASR